MARKKKVVVYVVLEGVAMISVPYTQQVVEKFYENGAAYHTSNLRNKYR